MTTDLRTPITGTRMMADMAGFIPGRLTIRLLQAASMHRTHKCPCCGEPLQFGNTMVRADMGGFRCLACK